MRLDIAVDQPGAVGIADPRASLDNQRDGLLDGIASALAQQGLQILARDVLHDNEQLALVEAEIMNGDNIGMGEVRRSTRLLPEALLEGFIHGILLVQDLDGHISFQHQVTRPEDVRHPALSQTLQQLIAIVENCPFFHC